MICAFILFLLLLYILAQYYDDIENNKDFSETDNIGSNLNPKYQPKSNKESIHNIHLIYSLFECQNIYYFSILTAIFITFFISISANSLDNNVVVIVIFTTIITSISFIICYLHCFVYPKIQEYVNQNLTFLDQQILL